MERASGMTGPARATVGVVALAVATLALLECGMRVAGRIDSGEWPITAAVRRDRALDDYNALFREHPWLHEVAREGATYERHFRDRAAIRINQLGYRSPERPLARPHGVRRVLVSGGSTTFDVLARDEDATWPGRLEHELHEHGVTAEVWNAGLPGWTSLENVISLAVRDLALEPDVAVLFQGLNDLQPCSLEPFDAYYERHAVLSRRALAFDRPPVPWPAHLLLVERTRRALGLRTSAMDALRPPPEVRRVARLPDAAVETFARNVRSYVALARSGGARVLLVTQTVRLRGGSEKTDARYLEQWIPGLEVHVAGRELERLDDAMRAVAASEGVALADAARDVAWTDGDFGDSMHTSAGGSKKLARFLAPYVSALLAGAE
jgi:lysophospholipase L1-like esterase